MSIASTSSKVALCALALLVGCGGGKRRTAPDDLGLPALDHAWTVDELTAAATIVDATCTRAPAQLPPWGSTAFARLVDGGNRATLPAEPIATRQAALTRYTAATLTLYQTYLRCGRPAETLAANAALLEGYAEALAVGRAMRDAAPDGSPERAQRADGLATMADGLTGGVTSTINMLIDPTIPGHLPPEVTGRLGAAIALVRDQLPPGALDEALAALPRAAGAEADPDRRAALAAAAAALR